MCIRDSCCSVSGSTVVCDLAILPDSELSMRQHNSRVTSTCYYHLRRLRQIHRYVSRENMMQLVTSLVMSHIDCCNSVMVGLPASLPCLLTNGSRMLQLGLFLASIGNPTSLLLYTNSVGSKWNFGSPSKVHNIFHNCASSYLSDLVTFCSSDPHRRQLRSSTVRSAVVNHTSDAVWQTFFSVCAPDIWNNLPTNLRFIDSMQPFDVRERPILTTTFNS